MTEREVQCETCGKTVREADAIPSPVTTINLGAPPTTRDGFMCRDCVNEALAQIEPDNSN